MSVTARTTVVNKQGERVRKQQTFKHGTDAQNEAAAQAWLHKWELIRSGLDGSMEVDTLSDLIGVYLTGVEGTIKNISFSGYETALSTVQATLGPCHVRTINQRVINDYVSARRKHGAGRGIIKELTVLRNACSYAGLPSNWTIPKTLTRLPKRDSYTPTCGEVRTILSNTHPIVRRGALLAIYGGLRDTECHRIGWDAYDVRGGILCVPGAIRKTGHDNTLPVVQSLASNLSPVEDGKMVPMYRGQVESELKKSSRRAGLPLVRGFQVFRRVLCTVAEDAGWGQDSIALITGHARTSMVSRYSSSNGRMELKRKILEGVERRLNHE